MMMALAVKKTGLFMVDEGKGQMFPGLLSIAARERTRAARPEIGHDPVLGTFFGHKAA
ncbi:hypothetical protein [Aureimonas ureilytica]|uniref:hypothetical protein n=1 Tax=Aureimonas ureilytica TaxID=401562 RepID=UPI00138B15CA|nr:hypothetical protein [Aureimonas ureilytica]